MAYLALPEDKRTEKIMEMFGLSVVLLEEYKDALSKGDEQDIIDKSMKMKAMQEALDHEVSRIYEKTGMTPAELDTYIGDKKNYTDEEWEQLQNVSDKIELESGEIAEHLSPDGKEVVAKKKPRRHPHKGWVKS